MGMGFRVAHLKEFEHILAESEFVDNEFSNQRGYIQFIQMAMDSKFSELLYKIESIIGSCERRLSTRNHWYKVEAEIQKPQVMGILKHDTHLLIMSTEMAQKKFPSPKI